MNYHGNLPGCPEDEDDVDDVYLDIGDSIEVMGKRFIVESKSKEPNGFIVSDPDAPGSDKKMTSKNIKALWLAHKLRFIARDEHGLPIGIRQSLLRTMRAFTPSERDEMFRRYRYCTAVDKLGSGFSRSETGLTPTIQQVAAERQDSKPPHWASVYRWWKVWARSGRDIRALCPSNRRRGNRKDRLDSYMRKAIEKGVKEWKKPNQPHMRTAYNEVLSHCVAYHGGQNAVEKILADDAAAYLWPTYRTFCLACSQGDRTMRLLNRHGAATARYEMYPLGEGPQATFPLERVESDFKYLRIFVTDEATGLPLGTPFLMAAIDCYSGVVAGFDLGFDPPSYVAAARCLKHIVMPKDLGHFPNDEDGLPIIRRPYPVNGVPHQFYLDNDAVFHSRSFEESSLALGCNIDYVPPGAPYEKGKIERFWGSLQTAYLDMFPGKVLRIGKSDPQAYDPSKDAKLTLGQLNLLITKAIVDVHNQGLEPDTDRYRIDLWNEGVAVNPPRPARDHESLIELVGAYVTRRAERRGIRLFGLRYNSYDLAVYRSGFQSDPRVEIRYDPQNISEVWVIDKDQGISFAVPCTRQDYAAGLSEHQHNVIRRHLMDKSPKGTLRMKMLLLARLELFELGKQLIGGRNNAKTKVGIARFLGADRMAIDAVSRPIKDESQNDLIDLAIDDADDDAKAKADEAVVDELVAKQKQRRARPVAEPAPPQPRQIEPAQHSETRPAEPPTPPLQVDPDPPPVAQDPANVPPTTPSASEGAIPRRRRDRTLKVTRDEP
tara:strand:+ start:3514 stop:5835 length:2322 start_codon:yes stop_codon:yes gene_type:complete